MDKKELEEYSKKGTGLIRDERFENILLKIEKNLGNSNSEIREGSLDLLWELIDSDIIPGKKLIEIGNRMIRNIEEKNDEADSIFLRTFSSLIIALIISKDELLYINNTETFLTYEEYISWYNVSIEYVKIENDFRGYIEGKGWAHAISHSADLLRDLAFHRYSTRNNQIEILNLITSQFYKYDNLVFINNDDNRLARIIMIMMYREQLELQDYKNWIANLTQGFKENHLADFSENQKLSTVWFNITTFLRAIYFTLKFGMKNIKNISEFKEKPKYNDELEDMILKKLKTMDNGLNYT